MNRRRERALLRARTILRRLPAGPAAGGALKDIEAALGETPGREPRKGKAMAGNAPKHGTETPAGTIMGGYITYNGYPVARIIDRTPLWGGAPASARQEFIDDLERIEEIQILDPIAAERRRKRDGQG